MNARCGNCHEDEIEAGQCQNCGSIVVQFVAHSVTVAEAPPQQDAWCDPSGVGRAVLDRERRLLMALGHRLEPDPVAIVHGSAGTIAPLSRTGSD